MSFGEEYCAWARWLLQFGQWICTVILAAVPSVHSPESPTTDFLQVSVVHSALSLLKPTISGYKWNFLTWPFKWLSESPIISPWQKEPCCFSQLSVFWVPFWIWCCRLGSQDWGLDIPPIKGNPTDTEISLQTFSCHHRSPSSPLMTPPQPLPVVWWSGFFCPLLKDFSPANVKLVIQGGFLYNLVVIPDWS